MSEYNYDISITTDDPEVADFLKKILESAQTSHAVTKTGAYVSEPIIEFYEINSESV